MEDFVLPLLINSDPKKEIKSRARAVAATSAASGFLEYSLMREAVWAD